MSGQINWLREVFDNLNSKAHIFADGLGINLLWQGAAIAILTLISYVIGAQTSPEAGSTMAFMTLSFCEMFHAWNMRSLKGSIFRMKSHNKMLVFAIGFSFLLSVPVLLIPALQGIFSLAALKPAQYLIGVGLAALIVPLVETVKMFQRRK